MNTNNLLPILKAAEQTLQHEIIKNFHCIKFYNFLRTSGSLQSSK